MCATTMETGQRPGFHPPLTKEQTSDAEVVKEKLAAGAELVRSTLPDELTDEQEDLALGSLEHESGHTGQLLRYLFALDGERVIGTRTLGFMTMNHLPNDGDLASMRQLCFGETTMDGIGFGLGFPVLLDPTQAQLLGIPGEFYWGGAASTAFCVSPAEDLTVVFLTQFRPSSSYPIRRELRIATYQAITD